MSKGELIFGFVIIGIILVLGGLTIWASGNSFEEDYKFYSEWCPKLGAEISEPVKGYTWRRACFKVEDNIMTKYWIVEINTTDRYYLREYK